MSVRYSKEVHDYIRENYRGKPHKEFASEVNEIFGTCFTGSAMKSYLVRRKYSNGLHGVRKGRPTDLFPEEIAEYIKKNCEGITKQELIERIRRDTGRQYTDNQIKMFMHRHGLKNGIDCTFKKGIVPYSKGKRQEEFMTPEGISKSSLTRFKKGQVVHNQRQIGATTIDSYGYVKIKVANPNKWKFLAHVTREEHNGPIPKGHALIFLDGNKKNCSIDNLELITKAELAVINSSGRALTNPETTKAEIMLARLKIAKRQAQKRRRKKNGKNRDVTD